MAEPSREEVDAALRGLFPDEGRTGNRWEGIEATIEALHGLVADQARAAGPESVTWAEQGGLALLRDLMACRQIPDETGFRLALRAVLVYALAELQRQERTAA